MVTPTPSGVITSLITFTLVLDDSLHIQRRTWYTAFELRCVIQPGVLQEACSVCLLSFSPVSKYPPMLLSATPARLPQENVDDIIDASRAFTYFEATDQSQSEVPHLDRGSTNVFSTKVAGNHSRQPH